MNETGVYDFKLEYTFAGDYMAELDRQLALLLSTREGTMPLDREFGLCGYAAGGGQKPIHGGGHGEGGQVYPHGTGPGSQMEQRRTSEFNCKGGDHKCLTK